MVLEWRKSLIILIKGGFIDGKTKIISKGAGLDKRLFHRCLTVYFFPYYYCYQELFSLLQAELKGKYFLVLEVNKRNLPQQLVA